MNRFIKTALFASAASCVLLGFGTAHASDEKVLDACIQHFIASNLGDYRGKIVVHKERSDLSMPLSASGASKVVVSATSVHGKELASAVCHVDRGGNVVSLETASSPVKLSSTSPAAKPVVVADTDH